MGLAGFHGLEAWDLSALIVRALAFLCLLAPPAGASHIEAPKGWNTLGPPGGAVTSLAVVEGGDSGALVYAGTPHGILRSVDAGESWKHVTTGPLAAPVTDLATAPNGSQTLYGLVTDPSRAQEVANFDSGVSPGQLFRSVDGENFALVETAPAAVLVEVAPSSSDRLYLGLAPEAAAAGPHRLAVSEDGGQTWSPTPPLPALESLRALAVDPDDPLRLWVGGLGGVVRSLDGGLTWHFGTGSDGTRITSIDVSPVSGQRVWAGGRAGVLLSRDGGLTWSKVLDLPPRGFPQSHHVFADPQHVDRALVVVAHRCFVTDTAGVFWETCDHDLTQVTDLAFAEPNGGVFWASGGGGSGLERSFDGRSWTPRLTETSTRIIDLVLTFGESPTSLLSLENGLLHLDANALEDGATGDSGEPEWVADTGGVTLVTPFPPPGAEPGLQTAFQPDTLRFIDIEHGDFQFVTALRVQDRETGKSRTLPFPEPPNLLDNLNGNALAIDPRDRDSLWVSTTLHAADTTHQLWHSTDGGQTWTDRGVNLPRVLSLAVDPFVEGTVYAGTADGLRVSRDEGVTWSVTRHAGGANPLPDSVEHIAVDSTLAGRLLFAGSGRVARSGNAGATATGVQSRGLPAGEVLGLVADPVSGRFHAVVENAGVFTTPNSGNAWLERNGGVDPRSFTGSLTVDPAHPGILWAASRHGILRLEGAPPCVADGDTLCLNQGRFRVEAAWEDYQGGRGDGRTFPLTTDTGSFWFFDPDNLELVVKVLDAAPVNDHFWVFVGALTNVPYTLLVEDSDTDRIRDYPNPSGRFASFGDTAAFPADSEPASAAPEVTVGALSDSVGGVLIPLPPGAVDRTGDTITPVPPCRNAERSLCLNRFGITVRWKDFQGGEGDGQSIPLTDDTGAFWFFNPDNVELMVKVLDGTEVNGHHWLFLASLTNVEFTVRVTGASGFFGTEITNPSGTFASQALLETLP